MKNKKPVIARIILTALTVAAVGTIFYNSSVDAAESSGQSGYLLTEINRLLSSLNIEIEIAEVFIRKLAHFTEYAVLGALMTAAVYSFALKRGTTLAVVLPLGAAVAVCDELIQLIPAGRSCEIRDMFIDFFGVVFAAMIFTAIISIIEKRRKVKS